MSSNQEVVNALFWRNRSGCQWDLRTEDRRIHVSLLDSVRERAV
jgi:hypothetical protein